MSGRDKRDESDGDAIAHDATMSAPPGQTPPSPSSPSRGGGGGAQQSELQVIPTELYEAGAEVARGGMGRIVAAVDRRLGRRVAIKELLGDPSALRARFEREALITARLQHPAIVPVYEAGRWPSGEPFYAMKLVDGRSLKQVLADARSRAERLALLPHVITVVEALAYAHGEGVIHRDLKPANILVGSFGETVVIDWGLAKDLRADAGADDELAAASSGAAAAAAAASAEELTVAGSVLGTPAYMPPEQAGGRRVDQRADVYSLGAILYHLLAGEPPYHGLGVVEILATIDREPPRQLLSIDADLPADLVAIVDKAMARDPDARYPTARELAEELRRFQTGQLVASHRYSAWELARRWARRHRLALAVVGSALVVLGVSLSLSFSRVRAERDRAEAERASAQRRADELTVAQARSAAAEDPAQALSQLLALPDDSPMWPAARIIAADALASGLPRAAILPRPVMAGAAAPGGGFVVAGAGKAVHRIDVDTATVRTLEGHQADVLAVAVSGDDRLIASADEAGEVRLWPEGGESGSVVASMPGGVFALAFTPDGRALAIGGRSGAVRLQPLDGGPARELLDAGGQVIQLAFSPDGSSLAVGGFAAPLTVVDVRSGGVRYKSPGQPGLSFNMHFSPDSRRLTWSESVSKARVLELATGQVRQLDAGSPVLAAEFSPDGRQLAVGTEDGSLLSWALDGDRFATIGREGGAIFELHFSPDGRRIATADADGRLRVWEVGGGRQRTLGSHGGWITGLAWTPDSRTLASASTDRSVRFWPVGHESGTVQDSGASRLLAAAASADGRTFAAVGHADALFLFDAPSGVMRRLAQPDGWLHDVAVSADGRQVATLSFDGRVRLWSLSSMRGAALPCRARGGLVFSADGSRLAAPAAGAGAAICVWQLERGEVERRLVNGVTDSVALSADGARLAARLEGGVILLWERAGAEPRQMGEKDAQPALAFSPDGAWLASVDADGAVALTRLADGHRRVVARHESVVSALAFSPDGRRLASVGNDQRLLIAELDGDDQAAPIQVRLDARGTAVGWDAQGAAVVAATAAGSVVVYELAAGEARRLRAGDRAQIGAAALPGARWLIAAGADGIVRVWSDDLPREPAALRARLRRALGKDGAGAGLSAAPAPAPASR